MSAPELGSVAARLYDGLAPQAAFDADNGYALARFCLAIGTMFQPIEDLARDTPEAPGWSSAVDLERAPSGWLDWLAQFVGVTLLPGASVAESRARILATDGFRRGTPAAMRAAAQVTLTGSRVVFFREREENEFGVSDAYALEVVTLTDQTPDEDATRRALVAQKPAGIVMTFRASDGIDYEALRDVGSYEDVRDTYSDYEAALGGGFT